MIEWVKPLRLFNKYKCGKGSENPLKVELSHFPTYIFWISFWFEKRMLWNSLTFPCLDFFCKIQNLLCVSKYSTPRTKGNYQKVRRIQFNLNFNFLFKSSFDCMNNYRMFSLDCFNPYRDDQILPILRYVPSVTKVMLLYFIPYTAECSKSLSNQCFKNCATLHAFLI